MQDFLTNCDDDVCLSGGAEGADMAWGDAAAARGDGVIHFIFKGHRSRAPHDQKVVLDRSQLLVADPYLAQANGILKRKWPIGNEFVANLLRRNYYQIVWSKQCYAISEIGRDNLVKGGTAWAVAMFQILHPDGKLFVFDQRQEQWFQWKNSWCPISSPPVPHGVWTGIGSREMRSAGEQAISELLSGHADREETL